MRIRISAGYALTGEFEDRQAARVIVVDMGGRTLLFRGGDPDRPQDGTWWFTPGGGVEPGESVEGRRRASRRPWHRAAEHGTRAMLGELYHAGVVKLRPAGPM